MGGSCKYFCVFYIFFLEILNNFTNLIIEYFGLNVRYYEIFCFSPQCILYPNCGNNIHWENNK